MFSKFACHSIPYSEKLGMTHLFTTPNLVCGMLGRHSK